MQGKATAIPRSAPGLPASRGRCWLLLGRGSLALGAGYPALVLGQASWAEVQDLHWAYPLDAWHIRPFSAAGWRQAQLALAGGLAAWLAWGPGSRAGRHELRATCCPARLVARRAGQQWRGLAPGERWWLGMGHLALLMAVRLYLSLTTPWNDDAASCSFFVRHGLLAVSAYYPTPNHHLLANTLAWVCYQRHPGFWWSMRLPVLRTSMLGTVGLFGVVLGRLRFWPALLAAHPIGTGGPSRPTSPTRASPGWSTE